MINFTVGPVQSSDIVRTIGSKQIPYFRTTEFSEVMLENEKRVLKLANAPEGARAVFMTASGTGSMEATVVNVLTRKDKVLIIHGGSFGQRFVQLLQMHQIPHTEVIPPFGDTVTEEQLFVFENCGYTALLVNIHETSTGVLYDAEMLGRFCKRNGMLFIVDAISSFLADPFDIKTLCADVMIAGSQKALACPPGVSIIILSQRAICRVNSNNPNCMYLNLKTALENQARGQTPFTPAVGILLQIHERLKEIEKAGGADYEINKAAMLAQYFRRRITGLPLKIFSSRLSNAVTPLHPLTISAYTIFEKLKNEYGIWICPNGGELRDKVMRVGHIGELSTEDYDILISALENILS